MAWSSFTFRASHATLVDRRGITTIMSIMGSHIPSQKCCISFIFLLTLSISIRNCVTFDMWSCTSCQGGLFALVINGFLSSSSHTAFLILSCRYCSGGTSVSCKCFVCCLMSPPVFITHIVYKCLLWLLSFASAMTPCIQGPPPLCLTTTVDPREKAEAFLSIIVLIMFTLTDLWGLVPGTVIIHVHGWSIDLWQKAPYGSVEQHWAWTQKPCSHWCWPYL